MINNMMTKKLQQKITAQNRDKKQLQNLNKK